MTAEMTGDAVINRLTLLDPEGYEHMLEALSQTADGVIIGFLNQHGYNLIIEQPHLQRRFLEVDYLLRDGIGMKLACKLNGIDPSLNLNGTDFIPALLENIRANASQPLDYYAMGTREPWLTRGAANLFGSRRVRTLDGFQKEQDYVDFFRDYSTPGRLAVVVLAMGMPKQERIAQLLKHRSDCACLIICGSAILDFAAHRVDRAPHWMRVSGLEWLFRLFREPRRLFRRYVIGIPRFLLYVLRNRAPAKGE